MTWGRFHRTHKIKFVGVSLVFFECSADLGVDRGGYVSALAAFKIELLIACRGLACAN